MGEIHYFSVQVSYRGLFSYNDRKGLNTAPTHSSAVHKAVTNNKDRGSLRACWLLLFPLTSDFSYFCSLDRILGEIMQINTLYVNHIYWLSLFTSYKQRHYFIFFSM